MQSARQAGTVFTVVRQGIVPAAGLHGTPNLRRDDVRARIRMIPKEAVLDEALLDKIRDPRAEYMERRALVPEAFAQVHCLGSGREQGRQG